jgi:suppressor of G2 allele of SKP1
VHLKTENYTAAIADANKAVGFDPANPKAYLRKGVAAFHMEEYVTAKAAFEKGQALDSSNGQFKTWIRKCNAEIEEEMVGEDVAAQTPPPAAAAGAAPAPAQPAYVPPPPKPAARFRHDFIQNPTTVTVSVYLKGANKDNCEARPRPLAQSAPAAGYMYPHL